MHGCDCLCLCVLPLPCVPCGVIVVAVVLLGDTLGLLVSTLHLLVLPWDREREDEDEASSRDSAVEDSPESCLSSSSLFLFLSPPLLLSASLLSFLFLFFCLPAFLSSSGCSHGWRRTSSRVGRSSGHFAKHNFSRFLHSGERKKEKEIDSREYERSGGNCGQFDTDRKHVCASV